LFYTDLKKSARNTGGLIWLIYIKFIGYLGCVFFEDACDKLNSALAEGRLPDRSPEKKRTERPGKQTD